MKIESEEALRALYGPVNPRAAVKEIDHLDHHCFRPYQRRLVRQSNRSMGNYGS